MKMRISHSARTSGSAVIIVLVLLFLMTILLTINGLSLHRFKQSLQSIEHREWRRYRSEGVAQKHALNFFQIAPIPLAWVLSSQVARSSTGRGLMAG
jgi:hypothetical protein